MQPIGYDPKRVEQFVAGAITLAEIEGVSRAELLDISRTGHRLFLEGKLDLSRTMFRGLLALDPSDAYVHMMLGAIGQSRRDYVTAQRWYNSALKLNPDCTPAKTGLAETIALATLVATRD